MIRREGTAAGSPCWILISQVDHARLSGRLAECWGSGPFARLEPHGELVAAVAHHDDGWAEWERSPAVHPRSGVPVDFMEMQPAESLAIWRRSISLAEHIGKLAAWLVSGHFSALAARGWSGVTQEQLALSAERELAAAFLRDQALARAEWLEAWLAQDPERNTPRRAEEGLKWLQWFDWLSLWLCCAERREPLHAQAPTGTQFTLDPRGPGRLTANPWPFSAAELPLAVPGRSVAKRAYQDAADLAAAPAAAVVLNWLLVPT